MTTKIIKKAHRIKGEWIDKSEEMKYIVVHKRKVIL